MIAIPKLPLSLQLLLLLHFAEPDIRLGLLVSEKKSDVITSYVCDLFLQSVPRRVIHFYQALVFSECLVQGTL